MIGRRPYAAFGNSTGDQQMLEYTKAGDGARLAMLVLHDDAKREYAYGPAQGLPDTKVGTFTQALYDEAKKNGWTVISMKNDWKRSLRLRTNECAGCKKISAMHIALKSYCQRPRGAMAILVQTCMKLITASLLPCAILIGALLSRQLRPLLPLHNGIQSVDDSSWPREKYSNGTRLIIYQPQIDEWKNFQDLSWRMAISLTPKTGKNGGGRGGNEGDDEHRQRRQARDHHKSGDYRHVFSLTR